jgi:hypothetical protein
MSLKERISEDLKKAMKSGDKERLETLRSLRATLLEKEIQLRPSTLPLSPEDETGILTGAAKKRKESIEQFGKGGRQDLVDQETRELAIIQEYLPKQLSRDEVVSALEQILAETGAKGAQDFGKVMPLAMKQLKGRTDGKLIQELVKEMLARN